MTRTLLVLAALVLAGVLVHDARARPAGEEPPMQLEVTIDGRSRTVPLDEDFSVEIGGKQVSGTRLRVTWAGECLVQDIVAFRGDGRTWLLVLQDTVQDDGSMSAETPATRGLLERTFEIAA